jgi:hypothetical protein
MFWVYNSLGSRANFVNLVTMGPHLPVEILLSILEVPFTVDSQDSLTTKPSQFLLINRSIHAHLLRSLYRTIILKSDNQLELLSRTSRSSPHLMKLISNIWVCTSLPGDSDVPRKAEEILFSTTLPSILLSATSLQRLALPSIGPHFSSALMHLPTTQPLVPNLHTLFVDKLASWPGSPVFTHFTNVKRLLAPLPYSRGPRMARGKAEFLGGFAVRSIGPLPTPLDEIAFCILAFPRIPSEESQETCMAKAGSKEKLMVSFRWTAEDDSMFFFDKWLRAA